MAWQMGSVRKCAGSRQCWFRFASFHFVRNIYNFHRYYCFSLVEFNVLVEDFIYFSLSTATRERSMYCTACSRYELNVQRPFIS